MSAPTTEAPYAYELGTKEATAAGKPFVTEAHEDHERAHRARLEESPAYEILKQHDLLTLRYRINSVEDIECVASNTTHSKNNRRIAMTFLAPGIGWCIYKSMTHTFEVPRGHIRLAEDGRGNYFFYGPGLHYIKDPYIRVQHENVPVGRGVLQHGNRTVVVIEQGYIGYAMDRGQPVLLPPGLHQWTSDTLVFEKMVDLNKNLIKLGPYTLLTVDEGYAAITQNNGRQVILPGGGMHFLTHRNWKFEKFMSQKIQTHSLERFEATSADNVLLVVIATVNWRIVDVEIAAKMAAETMRFDGSEVSQPGEDIRKLRNDVLRQAEASLASFIGTVNYSDTFHMAAAAHAPEAVSDDAMVLHGSAIFDVKKIKTAVEDANDVTMTYGVRVMSINIISAKPADNSLMMSLAKGAVAAAEAQQAETAAQGNASAARIEAEGLAQADVIRAKADAAAAEIRAEGAKRAAGLIESSSVATELAKIEKTGLALGKSSTFFFGNDPHAMSSVLANPALVPRR